MRRSSELGRGTRPVKHVAPEITPPPGGGSNAIGVQIRQLLFFGGALSNQAFHAAVIC